MELPHLYSAERRRLELLSNDTASPVGDYLHAVFGEGPQDAALMLIGEAPGAEEALCGRPFVGRAGRQLSEMLDKAGIARAEAFVTNAVKYRPMRISAKRFSNRTPSPAEIMDGLPLLKAEIECVNPLIIATLGNSPLLALRMLAKCQKMKIGDMHGKAWNLSVSARSIPVVPLYHPASGIYNRSLIPVMEGDLLALGVLIRTMQRGDGTLHEKTTCIKDY